MYMPRNAAIPAATEDPIGTYRIIATGDNSGEPYKRVRVDQWTRVNTIDVGGYETLSDNDIDALSARAKRVRIAAPGGEWHQQWANWHQHVQNAANAAEAERERYRLSGATNWGPELQRVQSRDTYLDMDAHPYYAQKHVKRQQEALGAYGSAIAGGVRAAGQGFEQVLDRLLVGNEAAANAGYAVQQGRQHAQEEVGGDLPTLEGVSRSVGQMALTGGNVPLLIGLAAAESGSQAMSQAAAEGYDWDAQARQGLAQAAIEGGVTGAFSVAGKGGWESLMSKMRKSHLAGRAGATAYLRELVSKSTVKPGTKLAKDLVAGVKDVAKDSLWELLEEHTITNLGLLAEQGILDKPGTWRQAAVQANIDTAKQAALMSLFGGAARGAAYGVGRAAGRNDAPTRPPVPTTRKNILAALDAIDKDIKQAEAAGDVEGADMLRRLARNGGLEGLRKDAARLSQKAFADMMRERGWDVLDDAAYAKWLDTQERERKAPTPYEMSMDDARHELDSEIFMAALAIRKGGDVGAALPNTSLDPQALVAEARARMEQLKALRKKPWNNETARAVVDYLNTTGRLEDAGRGPQEQYGLVEDDASPHARMLRNQARAAAQVERAEIEARAKAEAEQTPAQEVTYPEVQAAPMEQGPPYPVLQPQAAQEAVPTQTEPVTEQPPVAQEAAPTQLQLPVDTQESVTQQVTQTQETPEWVKRADDSSERQAASEARAAARGHRMADMQRGWMAQTPETPTAPTRETHEPAQKQTQASEPTPTPNKKKLKWLGEFRVGENTTGHLYYDSEEKKFYEEMNDNTWRPLAHRAYKRATEAYSSNRTIDVWTEATPEHVDELREKAGDKFATYTWGELEEAGGLNIYGKRDKSPQLKYERQLRYALGSKKPRAPKLSDDGEAQGGVATRGPVAPVEPVGGNTGKSSTTRTDIDDDTFAITIQEGDQKATVVFARGQQENDTPEEQAYAPESVTAPPVQEQSPEPTPETQQGVTATTSTEQSPAHADDTPEELEARGEWRATTPRENVKVGGRLLVIDSGDLITSTDDGYDHSLQARDRQSEASRQAIMQMGANFDPERARYGVTTDSGPAIVVWREGTERGADGKPIARGWHVLSGNGRTKGVQEAYAVNRGDAYRGMVRGVSARMGADTNAVDAMKRPQLVRVLDERGGKTDQEIARLSNMDVIQRMSTAEQARMDADAIGPILHLLNPGEDGNLMVAKNAPFLRAFAEAVHDESLIGTDGGWSPTIEKRIQAAVLASLFENTAENRRVLSVALEDADALGVRKILNAVLSEGPKLAAQADTKPDYGVMRELGRSLMGYIRYRQQLLSGQVKSLQDFLDQVDMFDSWSPVEEALIRGLDERGGGKGGSAAKVRTWLGRYQQLVAARDTSTGSLLGDEPSPDEGKLELLQMAGNDAAWDGMTWVGEATFASMAGPKAAGADRTRLETAILMQSFGFSRDDIFSETGWWEIVPGQWVFEVDDSKGKLVGDVDNYTGALQGIYANDELYRQYPSLRNVPVKMVVHDGTGVMSVDEGGRAGVGSIEVRARTKRDAELTLLHEIQHLIQDIENHGRGTSLQDARARADEQGREAARLKNTPEYQQAEQALNDAYAKYFMGELDEAGLTALEKRLREENGPYRQLVKLRLLGDDYRSYLAYTGEAESRLVQMRRVMTKAARKAEPPWVTLERMLRAEGLLPDWRRVEDVLHTTHKRAPVIYARRINVEVNRLLREAGVQGRMSIEVVDEVGRMTDAEAAAHGVEPGTRKAADVDTATGRVRLYRGATLQDAAHEVAHWFWDSGLLTAQERAAVEAEYGDLGQRANHEAAAKAAAAWWSSREGKPNTLVRRAWTKLVRLANAVARAMGKKVSVEDVFEGMYGGHIARREANAARGLLDTYASPRFQRANAPHPGQKGWSEHADMSARAEEALARGLKTADMIAKEYGVTAAEVKATLRPAEWHHVLMRGRKTPAAVDFYDFDPSEEDSPDAARLADMRERVAGKRAEAQSVNALAKAAKEAGFVVEKDGFGASVMRPGESLAAGRITENRIDIYPHDDGRLRAVAERLGMRHDAEADVYLGVDGDTYASTMGDTDAAYGTPDHALVELQRKLDALPTMAEKQAALDLWRFENQDVVREIEGTQDARLASEGFNSPVLYRGDRPGKTSFTGAEDASVRLKGNIFMFDDPKLAKFYTKERTNYLRPVETMGPKDGLYAMQANLGSRVFTMDARGEKWSAIPAPREIGGKKENPYGIQIDDLAEAIKAKGYTAMVVKNVGDQAGWGTQYVVFSPEQIAIRTSPLTLNPDGRLAGLEQGETRASALSDADAAYMDAVDRGDMETAQRMVDEAAKKAGYNVGPVWHGTADTITTFARSELGRTTGAASALRGYFFAKDRVVAEGYSQFARPKNIDKLKAKQERLEKVAMRAQTNEAWDAYEKAYIAYEKAELAYSGNSHANVVGAHLAIKNPLEHDYMGAEFRDETYDAVIQKALKSNNDSVIFRNTYDGTGYWNNPKTDIFVVFHPSQIKSADPITYDDAGNVIPLSQRFNADSPDIRYRDVDEMAANATKKSTLVDVGRLNRLGRRLFGEEWFSLRDKVLKPGGRDVEGRYWNAWADISTGKGNPEDTLYHEAYHRLEDLYLTDAELAILRKAVPDAEARAEGFVSFAHGRGGVTGRVRAVFSVLMRRLRQLLGMRKQLDQLHDTYDRLARGYYAGREKVGSSAVDAPAWADVDARPGPVSQELADKLDREPTVKLYRTMELIDGKLYPPMSGKGRPPEPVGVWMRSEENPDRVIKEGKDAGKFPLNKISGGTVLALYAPYFHAGETPLNDQFSSAWRTNYVTVEVEVPASELDGGYTAEGSTKAVGRHVWTGTPATKRLGLRRNVVLSRYAKIIRVIPDSEVASMIADMVKPKGISLQDKSLPPGLRKELEALGVQIEKTGAVKYRDTDAPAPNPVEQQRRAMAEIIRRGNVAVGRPDLANPAAGISEPTEAVVNAVDQVREHVVKHDEEAAREAEAILAQHGGARGMLALAARKAASGEPPSAGETIAFKRTLTDLGNHAHVTGNEADLRDTINMAHYYRQMGTVLGREMRLRREDLNPLATLIESMYEPTEPERVRRQKLDDAIRGYEDTRLSLPAQLREQILRATMSEQERINAINAAIRERDGSSPNPAVVRELARLYGARDRVLRTMARRAQGTIRALQAAGLHPGDAEIWSSDPASVIRAKRIISVHRAGMSDKLFELRLAAMLSGPLTHIKNTASNAAMMTWELTAQRGVEMALNSILRDSKSPSIGEIPHMVRGILPGLVQGTRAAWGIMLTEDYAGTRMDREEHWRGPAVGGVVGRVARGLSLTPMTAADQWFKHLAAHVEVQARAYRIAKSQGLTGDALSARIQELIADPSSEAWTEAIAFAHHVTFQSELGRGGQSLMRARSATPGARHVFPFVTTNANLLKNIVRKSPLGALNMIYTVLRGGYTGSRDTAITHAAEQVLAWTVGGAMALTLGLWDDEEEPLVTGSAPWIATSRGERDLAYRSAPPNSIRTGEHTWRSYMAIEPFGPTLGILVDGLQAMRQASQTGQYDVVARRAAQRVGSMVIDRSIMTGMADLIQVVQSGEPGDYLTSFLASWMPNIVRQSVRAGDTAIRDTSDMGALDRIAHEAIPSGDSVPQRYDAWGQPVTKAGGYADRLLSPARRYDTSTDETARAVDTMLRVWNRRNPNHTWAPGPPQRGDMSTQQYEQYATSAGERALKLIRRRRLNYTNPTEADIKEVQSAIEQARRWAKERL